MCLQFGIVIFWQKEFGAKAAHKMLVILTPGSHAGRQSIFGVYFIGEIKEKIKIQKLIYLHI
jgi:hypothetical protein